MELFKKCKEIRLILSDVDGVLTDGGMYYSENGELLKKFNTRDGMAVELLLQKNIKTVLITKENSKITKQRGKKIKAAATYVGVQTKENELKKMSDVVYDFPGIRFSSQKTTDWDMTESDLEHLADSLYYMSLIVCYGSSISIDAVMLNKPIINIYFKVGDDIGVGQDPIACYDKRHYAQALESGGMRLVNNEEELAEWVAKYLENPDIHRANRKQLAKDQCEFMDGKSGERVGKFALRYLYS